MLIAEVFGRSISDVSAEAAKIRADRQCPFRGTRCTKSSKPDPIGICSLSRGAHAAVICPVRFTEGGRIFKDAAKIAFSEGCEIGIFPEVRILRVADEAGKEKKIGKVDFLLGKIAAGKVADFAALEVQASYFSGESIKPALRHFLANGSLDPAISDRRPDFRSSAQKRLMPQLQLKVPVFRRWGKKFFVVVDSLFFGSLPPIKPSSISNSEIIWLCYPMKLEQNAYALGHPEVKGTVWDDVVTSLREGAAPEKEEILAELQSKLDSSTALRPTLMRV